MIDVAEQRETEVLQLGELEVALHRVERRAEHDAICRREVVRSIAYQLPFHRAAGRLGFRVPPQQDPVTAQIGEPDGRAMLIGRANSGAGVPGGSIGSV